jgi:hypothetical protein
LEELRGTIAFPFNCTQVVVIHQTKKKWKKEGDREQDPPKRNSFFSFLGCFLS